MLYVICCHSKFKVTLFVNFLESENSVKWKKEIVLCHGKIYFVVVILANESHHHQQHLNIINCYRSLNPLINEQTKINNNWN